MESVETGILAEVLEIPTEFTPEDQVSPLLGKSSITSRLQRNRKIRRIEHKSDEYERVHVHRGKMPATLFFCKKILNGPI